MQSGMRKMKQMQKLSGIMSDFPRTPCYVTISVKNDCGNGDRVGTPAGGSRAGAVGSASQSV